VLLLGGADKLVGTTTSIHNNPWYREVYPRIKDVPVLTDGETIQSEELLAARPDAVLMSKKNHVAGSTKSGADRRPRQFSGL